MIDPSLIESLNSASIALGAEHSSICLCILSLKNQSERQAEKFIKIIKKIFFVERFLTKKK